MTALTAQFSTLFPAHQDLSNRLDQVVSAKAAAAPPVGGQLATPAMPPLSSSLSPAKAGLKGVAAAVGPPPKVKNALGRSGTAGQPSVMPPDEPRSLFEIPEDQNPMIGIMAQQSAAMTALVAHLAGGGDAMTDLQAQGSGTSSLGGATKGLMRRQKMQADLAASASTSEDVPCQASPCSRRRSGRVISLHDTLFGETWWVQGGEGVGASALASGSCYGRSSLRRSAHLQGVHGTSELGAGAVSSRRRRASSIHQEESPASMFQDRPASVTGLGRPFANLVPPSLAATTLSFMKEVEVLSTRKQEVKTPKKPSQPAAGAGKEEESPSPKRKPRYPRKPKAGAEALPEG